ncbi:unnamed protein product, partial [Staurois parvus]
SGTQWDSSCGVWPSTAPTQLSRDIRLSSDIGVTGTQQDSSCGGHRCAQQGQFRTRVVCATTGTV